MRVFRTPPTWLRWKRLPENRSTPFSGSLLIQACLRLFQYFGEGIGHVVDILLVQAGYAHAAVAHHINGKHYEIGRASCRERV